MVGPPPPSPDDLAAAKDALRKELRAERRAYVAALADGVRALMFSRPPSPLAGLLEEAETVGLYAANRWEAPTIAYAKWLYERGTRIALPWFNGRNSEMAFVEWENPYDDKELISGPLDILQPVNVRDKVIPDLLIVPLLGFTAEGARLGQGGGHYDRWLAANPGTMAIGLAWDCQLREQLPVEPHDVPLAMVVTATRAYGAAS